MLFPFSPPVTPSAESVGRSETDRQPDYRRSSTRGAGAQTHYSGFGHEFDDHYRDIITITTSHNCNDCCAITVEHAGCYGFRVFNARGNRQRPNVGGRNNAASL